MAFFEICRALKRARRPTEALWSPLSMRIIEPSPASLGREMTTVPSFPAAKTQASIAGLWRRAFTAEMLYPRIRMTHRLVSLGSSSDPARPSPYASLRDHTLSITDIVVGCGRFPDVRCLTSSIDGSCKVCRPSTTRVTAMRVRHRLGTFHSPPRPCSRLSPFPLPSRPSRTSPSIRSNASSSLLLVQRKRVMVKAV